MNDIQTHFSSSRLKLGRAKKHIEDLIGESIPLSKDLYEIINGAGYSNALLIQSDCYSLNYKPKQPIADYFGAMIGDAVNNLRESLDYWANSALTLVGPKRKAHFPFAKKISDLKSMPAYKEVEASFPNLANFIYNNIKPCGDTNLHLWAVTHLSNHNKHNDFVPTVTIATINNINVRTGPLNMQDCTIRANADQMIHIIKSHSPITIDNNYTTSIDLTFQKGTIFEDLPVISTLQQMSDAVSQTLDNLEVFVVPYM